jgi:hypothetical protein
MTPDLIGGIICGTVLILANCYGLYRRIKNIPKVSYINFQSDNTTP